MAGLSTIYPDFQDALLAAISAGVTDARVSLGWPAGGLDADHVVITGAGEVVMATPLSTPTMQRDETLTATVQIITDYTSSEYATARDRAFAIEADVEEAISADPTLGDVVTFASVTRIDIQEAVPDDRTRTVGISLTVSAEATVTSS